MTLREQLAILVAELDRIHEDEERFWKELHADASFPDMVVEANGQERHFLPVARTLLHRFASALHRDCRGHRKVIDAARFHSLVRQAVADLHAEGRFASATDSKAALKVLKSEVAGRVAMGVRAYTHHCPARTLGIEQRAEFHIGPVTFRTRDAWIGAIEFRPEFLSKFSTTPDENLRWKALLKDALDAPQDRKPPGAASMLYSAIRSCPSLLSVEINGLEFGLSMKLADLVCKSALDAVSLAFGEPEYFHQQALHGERSLPLHTNTLVSSDGYLASTGSHAGAGFPRLTPGKAADGALDYANLFDAFGCALTGLADPSTHPHPLLAQRWTTALDWFAEGQREKSDAIALIKIAAAMDVLANGGKTHGIRAMVEHLTGRQADDVVVKGESDMTLAQVVKEMYDEGRSQILHGSKTDRMVSMVRERRIASVLGRIVLIECALRLRNYTGTDDDKAFRTMTRTSESEAPSESSP